MESGVTEQGPSDQSHGAYDDLFLASVVLPPQLTDPLFLPPSFLPLFAGPIHPSRAKDQSGYASGAATACPSGQARKWVNVAANASLSPPPLRNPLLSAIFHPKWRYSHIPT
ncbi:uncharacterized protein BDCG_02268 [Blastomyces dermatitidis ER-3]|uniref:Uncharacterized protein n=1 Tax=Ajellomyces dermatitidis (strain ER-3 / ATCC MYA-2586) TaxID=559297 RepID=A0ABP2EUF7_AJEDR|nr:uncharacterized protein BDCG_02268 [Blastomyces dermatitidis ER-3]EEQ87148.2 hypothetical protein BDCG_02268 [Blastomyces dermatitidis ER-3]